LPTVRMKCIWRPWRNWNYRSNRGDRATSALSLRPVSFQPPDFRRQIPKFTGAQFAGPWGSCTLGPRTLPLILADAAKLNF
jgi:hypothetical protein